MDNQMTCQVTEKIFNRFEKCGEPATHTCRALGLLCSSHTILALIAGLEPMDHPEHIDTQFRFSREGASAWCKLCNRWRTTLDTGYKDMKAEMENCSECHGTGRVDDCGKTSPCEKCAWIRKALGVIDESLH